MKNLGQELTEEQLKLMILEADYNGDGVIDFEGLRPYQHFCFAQKLIYLFDNAILSSIKDHSLLPFDRLCH